LRTESVDPRYADLDRWPTEDLVRAMFEAQLAAVAAIGPALTELSRAIDAAAGRLAVGGRIAYAGAGTSARIGVQDGAELPPTFDWPHDRLLFLVAGGMAALTLSIEGAEDDAAAGRAAVSEAAVGPADVVIGVAASGATPYTRAAVQAARAAGALTIGLANNPGAPLLADADHGLLATTGAEVVAGSTRMKAGTAQKVLLNLLSTGIMVRLGRVHGGLMVAVQARNAKLRRRAQAMVATLAGCGPEAAEAALTATGWQVRPAVLVARGLAPDEAARRLAATGGRLRPAIEGEAPRG
jgi:N-acetylmuramic acid 6-phosphate etherase